MNLNVGDQFKVDNNLADRLYGQYPYLERSHNQLLEITSIGLDVITYKYPILDPNITYYHKYTDTFLTHIKVGVLTKQPSETSTISFNRFSILED